MGQSKSYVYFAFKGNDFDPSEITTELGIEPTDSWQQGQAGKHIQQQMYSCWQLRSTLNEPNEIDKHVDEVVAKLSEKTKLILDLKNRLALKTVLEIVMYVDINETQSTPFLGHSLEVIDFLHQTRTITDLDVYRYHSN